MKQLNTREMREREKDGSRLAAKKKRKERKRNAASQQFLLKIYSVRLLMKNITSYPSFLVVSCHTSAAAFVPSIFPPFFSFSYLTCSDLFSTLSRDLFLCHLYFLFFAFIRPYVPCLAQSVHQFTIHFSMLRCETIRHVADNFTFHDYAILRLIYTGKTRVLYSAFYIKLCVANNVDINYKLITFESSFPSAIFNFLI